MSYYRQAAIIYLQLNLLIPHDYLLADQIYQLIPEILHLRQLLIETARERTWINFPVNQKQVVQTIEFGDVLLILMLLQNSPLSEVSSHTPALVE